MAKNKKEKKSKDEQPAQKKLGVLFIFRAVILPLLLAVLFLPTTIVMGVLMLPTLVAFVVDNNRPKALAMTVGALNLAGATTAWFQLLRVGHNIDAAQDIAMDPQNVFIAYGAAFVAWILYVNVTALVANVISRRALIRIHSIVKRQNALKDVWGLAVVPKSRQFSAANTASGENGKKADPDDEGGN